MKIIFSFSKMFKIVQIIYLLNYTEANDKTVINIFLIFFIYKHYLKLFRVLGYSYDTLLFRKSNVLLDYYHN